MAISRDTYLRLQRSAADARLAIQIDTAGAGELSTVLANLDTSLVSLDQELGKLLKAEEAMGLRTQIADLQSRLAVVTA